MQFRGDVAPGATQVGSTGHSGSRNLGYDAAMSRVWIALAVVGCASDPGGVPQSWHVSGGFLRDADGRAVILRGVNLSGAQKSAPYVDDKQLADWQRLRADWGMNAVRFVMTWAAVEPD